MKDRRGIYLAAMIVVASLVYFGCGDTDTGNKSGTSIESPVTAEHRGNIDNQATISGIPAPIAKEVIFNDFKDISDNETPQAVLGGTFYLNRLYLPSSYSGTDGEVFYVSMEDGHIVVLQKYQIGVQTDGSLKYQVVETRDDIDKPSGDFEAYSLRKGEWQLIQ